MKMREQTATLILVANSTDQNFDKCTYVLNLLDRKCSTINVRLNQVFIGNESTSCFADQLKLVGPKSDWILVASTSELNDQTIFTMLEENNNMLHCKEKLELLGCAVPVYNSNVFILESSQFRRRLATCFKHIQKHNRLKRKRKMYFQTEENMKEFASRLSGLFQLNIELIDGATFKCEGFEVNRLLSNYARFGLELKFFDQEWLDKYEGGASILERLTDPRDFLEDNFINADFYVYELSNCIRFLDSTSEDMAYLSSKIDMNAFLGKLQLTVQIIEQAFTDYKPEDLCVSFNGGKDCCVVLYLAYAVALKLGARFPLNAVLIQIKNQFKEMDEYVKSLTESEYTRRFIEFIYFTDMKPMKESLMELKQTRPRIKAILIGTRRSDGAYFKDLEPFAYTDGDWPRYMRVNPILDWTFSEIWYFMRLLKLPYCSLYDNGYTSIDSTLNTIPNGELLAPNGVDYLPAWRLQDQSSERFSRRKK